MFAEQKVEKKLSALELLARKRAEARNKASTMAPATTKVSLLDKLKNGGGNGQNGNPVKTTVSVASRLQSLKRGPITTDNNSNGAATASFSQPKTHTLASKLASLRKSKPEGQIIEKPEAEETNVEVVIEENKIDHEKKDKDDPWVILNQLKDSAYVSNINEILAINKVPLYSGILEKLEFNSTTTKRKHEELFSVYYPNTNNRVVKKQAIANFSKPSPDDVVINQQKAAFEVDKIKEKVADLSIQDKQSSKTVEKEEDINDDDDDDEKLPFEEPVVKTYKKVSVPTKPKNAINISSYLDNKKPHLNFVVLGHVDAGKSTLMGRLLYDVGAVDTKLIRKLQKESEMIGKSSFHLAWVMDQTSEERNRGVTVDICTSDFATTKSSFTIVDAPGHRDFVPNAIVGISQADVAVLSVDCGTDAFESGFNLDGQTKEHALLARSLGIKHIVVAMNKMDSVSWYEGRFNDIRSELAVFFEEIGFKGNDVSWVPCSGLSGEGIFKTPYPPSQTWYQGPSLVGELENVALKLACVDESVTKEPFLFNILDVTPTSKNTSAIISGKVESGTIQPGETITIYPSEQSCVVDSILCGNDSQKVDIALHGDFVQLKLHNAFPEDIQGGDLASIVGFDIPSSQEFTSRLLTFRLDRPLLPGTSLMLFRGATEQPCRIKKLCCTVDKSNPSKVLKKKVKHLGSQQAAIVEIELVEKKRRIPMLTFEQNKKLGRVVLRKEGRTIGAALIKSLDY